MGRERGPYYPRTLRPPLEPTDGLRCESCNAGYPARRVLVFALVFEGKPAGQYRLCGTCWGKANPPEPVDPLSVPDEAA